MRRWPKETPYQWSQQSHLGVPTTGGLAPRSGSIRHCPTRKPPDTCQSKTIRFATEPHAALQARRRWRPALPATSAPRLPSVQWRLYRSQKRWALTTAQWQNTQEAVLPVPEARREILKDL